jgi:hypothetical protein
MMGGKDITPTRPTEPKPAPAPETVAVQPPAVPAPVPKRQQRRDGPPGDGERQVHFLAGGLFALPDGSSAKVNDYCNLPEDVARQFVERGVANFVEVEIPAVTGDARMEINISELLGADG